MKIMTAKVLFIITILSFSSYSCTIRYYDANKLLNDYTTEGFLDRDHFQVIIKGDPDKEARGLVAERESAYNSAKIAMNDKIFDSLISYNLNYYIDKLKIKPDDIRNLPDVKKGLAEKLQQFLKHGYIAFEYYNIDNSAVLVYRIFKEDLIDDIESIKPGIVIKDDNAEKKSG